MPNNQYSVTVELVKPRTYTKWAKDEEDAVRKAFEDAKAQVSAGMTVRTVKVEKVTP